LRPALNVRPACDRTADLGGDRAALELGPLELTVIHYPFTVLGFVAPVTDWEIPPLVRADIAPRCTMPILLCLSSRPVV
jgi:hypothetical protein